MNTTADEPEWVLCKRWRVEKMELTRDQLASMTGFSAGVIKDYERPGKIIDAAARQRYRMACAAAEFGIEPGWENRTLTITRPIKITVMRDEE